VGDTCDDLTNTACLKISSLPRKKTHTRCTVAMRKADHDRVPSVEIHRQTGAQDKSSRASTHPIEIEGFTQVYDRFVPELLIDFAIEAVIEKFEEVTRSWTIRRDMLFQPSLSALGSIF